MSQRALALCWMVLLVLSINIMPPGFVAPSLAADENSPPSIPGELPKQEPSKEEPVKEDPAKEDLPYKYVGNNFSLKFHRPKCKFAQAMAPGHVVLCHFRRDAVSQGMAPCRYCLPPFWTTTKVVLLPHRDIAQDPSNKPAVEVQSSDTDGGIKKVERQDLTQP